MHAVGDGEWGIRVLRSRGGGVTDSLVRGASAAGVAVADCDACGTLVEGVTAEQNGVGVLVRNAGHVLVLGSTLSGNATGVAVETSLPGPAEATRSPAPSRGAEVRGNALDGNATGVLVRGGWHVSVTDNTVTGYADAGLHWDPTGLDACFEGNRDPARESGEPVTRPPHLQLLFPCSGRT